MDENLNMVMHWFFGQTIEQQEHIWRIVDSLNELGTPFSEAFEQVYLLINKGQEVQR